MSTMDQWTAAVCADLGLDASDADFRAVLDLTRDVAHGVARPAAPLTAYLVGVAVGRGIRRVRDAVTGLLQILSPPAPGGPPPLRRCHGADADERRAVDDFPIQAG